MKQKRVERKHRIWKYNAMLVVLLPEVAEVEVLDVAQMVGYAPVVTEGYLQIQSANGRKGLEPISKTEYREKYQGGSGDKTMRSGASALALFTR